MQGENLKDIENKTTVRQRKKWDSIDQYVLYLRHFAAYEWVKEFVKGKSIAEVGFGTGYGSDYLSLFASSILAMDISKECVTYCHAKYGKTVSFAQASGLNIPLKENSVDFVLSFQVIEHIEPSKVRKYLSELKRVLSEEGIVIISTPNRKLRLLPFQKPWNPEHQKEYTSKEFGRTLETVFEEVEVYGLVGSEEIQLRERYRSKQNPFEVYIIWHAYFALKKLFPLVAFQIAKKVQTRSSQDKEHESVSNEIRKRFRTNDFRILHNCPKDSLDFFALCRRKPT